MAKAARSSDYGPKDLCFFSQMLYWKQWQEQTPWNVEESLYSRWEQYGRGLDIIPEHSQWLVLCHPERASKHPWGAGLSQRLVPQCWGPTGNRCGVQDSSPSLPHPSPVLSPVPTTFPGKGRGSAWPVPTRGRERLVLGIACRPAQPSHYETPSELFHSWVCLLIYIDI